MPCSDWTKHQQQAFQFRLVARLGPSVGNTSFFSRPQTGPAWPSIISISAPPFFGPRSPTSSPALRLMANWTRHPAPPPFQAPSHLHQRLDQASATGFSVSAGGTARTKRWQHQLLFKAPDGPSMAQHHQHQRPTLFWSPQPHIVISASTDGTLEQASSTSFFSRARSCQHQRLDQASATGFSVSAGGAARTKR